MFSTLFKTNFTFSVTFIFLSANAFNFNQSDISCFGKDLNLEMYLFVWGFMPYQQYFSYLTATIHKAMFPGLFLTSI